MTTPASSNERVPPQVILVWCPGCGRDDRFNALRQTMPHNAPSGKRCPGVPIRVKYEPVRPEVLR